MATTTYIPVETYLNTVYEPDVDYLDGQIEERNVGEYDHNVVQLALVNWFNQHGKLWNLRAIQEQRTRISETSVLIPDVAVFERGSKVEQVFDRPYLVAIEVLSPKDRHSRLQEKIEAFKHFGIAHIWVIDSRKRIGWNCSDGNWIQQNTFPFKAGSEQQDFLLDELFTKIDADELP
jgi:Uma2 family endonuclease